MKANEHDPEATVWLAAAELEKKQFTRKEIADALLHVQWRLDQ